MSACRSPILLEIATVSVYSYTGLRSTGRPVGCRTNNLSSYCLLAIRCFALLTCFQFLHKIWKFYIKFDDLIFRKMTKFVATICQILRLKCIKFDSRWGSAPDPARGACSAPPDLLAVSKLYLAVSKKSDMGITSEGNPGMRRSERLGVILKVDVGCMLQF